MKIAQSTFPRDAYFPLCTNIHRADFVITNDGTHFLKYISKYAANYFWGIPLTSNFYDLPSQACKTGQEPWWEFQKCIENIGVFFLWYTGISTCRFNLSHGFPELDASKVRFKFLLSQYNLTVLKDVTSDLHRLKLAHSPGFQEVVQQRRVNLPKRAKFRAVVKPGFAKDADTFTIWSLEYLWKS